MKRHLAPALFSLSLCAVMGGVQTAGAQMVDGVASAVVDSAVSGIVAPAAPSVAATAPAVPVMASGPMIIAPTPVLLNETVIDAGTAPFAVAPAVVEWKMPTSRALMIGGAATALVGLFAVGGDTGAVIALSGTAVAVYGLYLHYNR